MVLRPDPNPPPCYKAHVSWILPAFFALVAIARLALMALNLRYVSRNSRGIPVELAETIDRETLENSTLYTTDKLKFGILRTILSSAVVAVALFAGGLEAYDSWIASFDLGFVSTGVTFFAGVVWLSALVEIPFALYTNFRLEARHGFNRMTPALFWTDTLKGTLLGSVLVALLAAGALWLVQLAPSTWWLWAFVGYSMFSVLLVLISPYVIEPLFFKTVPLKAEGLEEALHTLSKRAGVRISQLLEVDASRRSSHSNAYFTGLGRVKRVVLFDTLREKLSNDEILAIVAHELGHWKLKHIPRRFIVSQALSLAALGITFFVIDNETLAPLLRLEGLSFHARIVLLAVAFSLASFPLTPLFSYWSRVHEWQADTFACQMTGSPQHLGSALAKLARDNLSNLHSHPLYQSFYYSHPPVVQRIARWQSSGTAKPAPPNS